jgi:hypothetical protein
MWGRSKSKQTVAVGGNLPSHPGAPRKASGARHGTNSFVQGAKGARGKVRKSAAKKAWMR